MAKTLKKEVLKQMQYPLRKQITVKFLMDHKTEINIRLEGAK